MLPHSTTIHYRIRSQKKTYALDFWDHPVRQRRSNITDQVVTEYLPYMAVRGNTASTKHLLNTRPYSIVGDLWHAMKACEAAYNDYVPYRIRPADLHNDDPVPCCSIRDEQGKLVPTNIMAYRLLEGLDHPRVQWRLKLVNYETQGSSLFYVQRNNGQLACNVTAAARWVMNRTLYSETIVNGFRAGERGKNEMMLATGYYVHEVQNGLRAALRQFDARADQIEVEEENRSCLGKLI